MITVGVIGAGYIGPVHLGALSRIEGVRVKSVCDVNPALAEAAAKAHNIERSCSDYEEVLRDDDIDAIHNCTPNKHHYRITKEALERGKHVLSEKPLAMKLEEAGELLELALRKGVVTGVHFCYRYYPVVQEAAVRIKRGDLGDVRMVTGSYLQDWLSNPVDYSWRLERKESGASSVTADLGSHWFDLVQFATGLKVTDVLGDFATLVPVRKRPKVQVTAFGKAEGVETEDVRIELEDYSSVLFRLSNGAPGSFSTSQTCAGRKSDAEFQIYGSRCSMAWNHRHSTELWIGRREGPNETLVEGPALQDVSTAAYATLPGGHPLGYHDAVLNLFRDFYNVVKKSGKTSPVSRPTFETGYEEMKILDAVVRSSKKRRWMKVEWV